MNCWCIVSFGNSLNTKFALIGNEYDVHRISTGNKMQFRYIYHTWIFHIYIFIHIYVLEIYIRSYTYTYTYDIYIYISLKNPGLGISMNKLIFKILDPSNSSKLGRSNIQDQGISKAELPGRYFSTKKIFFHKFFSDWNGETLYIEVANGKTHYFYIFN